MVESATTSWHNKNIFKDHIKSNGELDSYWANNRGKVDPLFHIRFVLDLDYEAMKKITEMLSFDKKVDNKQPPLFTLSNKDEQDNIIQHKNMQLTKLTFKCKDCDYTYRISKQTLAKHQRRRKNPDFKEPIRHQQEKGHKLEVKQTFEKYTK